MWLPSSYHHLDGAAKAGFELLSIMLDQYQQNQQSERFI